MVNKEQVKALQTKQQRYAARKWDRMFVSRRMIMSKAFLALETAAACQVFLIFLNKCVPEKVQAKPGRREHEYIIANNGEIQFTYIEAKKKYGILDGRFRDAIDELLDKGFIDIAKTGSGLQKDVTLYAISDRWEKYDTPEFIKVTRPKRTQRCGFTKGNKCGRNSKK